MSNITAFKAVSEQISRATTLGAIFGSLPSGDETAKRSHVRKSFAYLAKLVHPDHAPSSLALEAAKTFELLNGLRRLAEEAIARGRYDEPIAKKSDETEADFSVLVSGTGEYRIRTKSFRDGDFSVLYRGTATQTKTPIIAKVARAPTDNTWLETESVLLRRVLDANAGSPIRGIARFMPALLDTFLVNGSASTRYRVEILKYEPDKVSVADIMATYPRGLDAPQAAWVARRVIAQSLAAFMLGRVHTAITPDHVLVDPFTHEPIHIGWTHAIERGRIQHVIDRWKDVYPSEVFAKKDADHRTDLYMAGATITKLFGGDVVRKTLPSSVPNPVAQIILRCLEQNPARRPQDGMLLLDEFTRVVRKEWGTTYRPLLMPMRSV